MGYRKEAMSRSHDVNKNGGGVNDLWTARDVYVNKDGGRPCLRRSRDVNEHGGWPNYAILNLTLTYDM